MHFTKKIEKELIYEVLLFCIGVLLISFYYTNDLLLTFLLVLVWLIGIIFWHKKHDVYFFIIGSICGPIGEIVSIHFGAWSYTNPMFLGIPLWLPFGWGLVTVLIKRIAETFVKIEMK